MESEQFEEYKSLVNEITKGMEQVKQLKASSSSSSSSSSNTNLEEPVLERMLSSYEEALSILNGSASQESDTPASSVSSVWEATQTGELSSEQPKPMKRWVTEQVSLTTLSALADDGHSWRKYGQKSILGSQYPRSYYRCTHKYDQGCFALKQIQRSDDDPSMYDITYKGKHTCSRIQPVVPTLLRTSVKQRRKEQWARLFES